MPALLTLQGVSKRFGETSVLEQTSLSIENGLTTALIGPSGCGKSTILRLVVGLATPDSGRIEFAGQEVNPSTITQLRSRIGYVIQEGGLFPHLTARDNVLLMARHLNKPAAESEQRLNELCDLTQLDCSVLQRYPTELSGGQRQRIGLMRALMLSPELLLLDEPLGALDPLVRYALQRDLKAIFQQLKQTTLLVTHDLAEAAYLGDTIVLMNRGKIVQQGKLADLRTKPSSSFVTEFIEAQRPLAET
jgi:osmoprotectant transport system ATP-binding protein